MFTQSTQNVCAIKDLTESFHQNEVMSQQIQETSCRKCLQKPPGTSISFVLPDLVWSFFINRILDLFFAARNKTSERETLKNKSHWHRKTKHWTLGAALFVTALQWITCVVCAGCHWIQTFVFKQLLFFWRDCLFDLIFLCKSLWFGYMNCVLVFLYLTKIFTEK